MSSNGTTNSAGQDSLTRLAVKRLHWISTCEIPRELGEKVSLAVLDYLGAVASGLESPWAPQICQYARSRKGRPESHAWGLQKNISAETAAFVNATLAHRSVNIRDHSLEGQHLAFHVDHIS